MTEPIFPDLLDSTMIVSYRSCPEEFFQAYCRGLTGKGRNVHLHAGGALAYGLEKARKSYFVAQNSPQRAVRDGIIAFTKYWGEWDPAPDEIKQYPRMLEAFYGYFEQWPFGVDPLRPIHTDQVSTIEYSFSVPLPIAHPVTGAPILYGGRTDMLGEISYSALMNDQYVVDEKTTSFGFGDNWAYQWAMRNQFLGYCFSAQQAGLNISKSLVRGIFIGRASISYTQAIASYSPEMMERWYVDLLDTVERMVADWKRGKFPRCWGDACFHYNRPCAFMPRCVATRPENYDNLYDFRRWNPLHRDPLGEEQK